MKKTAVLSICGLLLMTLAGTMLLPLLVAILYGTEGELLAWCGSIAITFIAGAASYWFCRGAGKSLGSREGFAVVALGWVLLSAFGALPFWLAENGIASYLDAYFETMSGFTTTGASILSDIESLPKGLLFWRSLTHWLGGMGIVVLAVAILPFLGAGGYQMLRAETPGPTADKLQPRIAQTAKVLWSIYVLLTIAEIILLLPVMEPFDAICHSFATLATGGFSTKQASLAHFDSAYVDTVVMVFMLLAGSNFVLHYRLMIGRGFCHGKDSEFKFYFGIILVVTAIITSFLWLGGDYPDRLGNPQKYDSFTGCLRYASFQVVGLLTTTGFVTADFDGWPNPSRILIVFLMIVGGCAGSTGGGVKVVRIVLLLKFGMREIQRLVRPKAVIPVKIGGHTIENDVVARVMGFMALYSVLFIVSVFLMTLILQAQPMVPDAALSREAANNSFLTAFGAVLATIGNIGPGFAAVGPTLDFSTVPVLGKCLLIFCMLLGRLEIYSVLIVLIPATWRR